MTFKEICKNAYDKLIENRRRNPLYKKDDYCEEHHIIPKSMGGSNSKENLVNLKASEHFLAHYLLFRIYRGTKNAQKMADALWSMCWGSPTQQRLISPEEYELAKRAMAAANSAAMKGEKNPNYGKPAWNKGQKTSEESKQKNRDAHLGKPSVNKGKKHTEDYKKKNRDAHKGRKWWTNGIEETQAFECPNGFIAGRLKNTWNKGKHLSKERRKNLSDAKKGEKNPNYGKPAWNKGQKTSEESKQKNSDAHKGRKLWNNGVEQKYFKECPGDGWTRGMLKKSAS